MAYVKTNWVNGITPINSDNLNNIENGIKNNENVINGIKGTILWTNPDPSLEFTPQTITLSSSDYDMLMFILKRQNNYDTLVPPLIIPKGYGGVGLSQALNGENRRRDFTYVDDTHYSCANGSTPDGTTANGTLIPLYVIGYKTGLFGGN